MSSAEILDVQQTAIEPRALRRALANFVTGVTVVATIDGEGRPRGLTANSFTSVSLDPPLLLVCIANTAASWEAFQTCKGFSVNVLSEAQQHVSNVFASKAPDKFDNVEWSPGPTGAPRIHGSIASFDCRVHNRIDAGDHSILIGEIVDFVTVAGPPLLYGQGGYISFSVQQAAVSQPPGKRVVVSCVLEREGCVLLVESRRADGTRWLLPGGLLTKSGSRELIPLNEAFHELGLTAEVTFLYSVFEDVGDIVHIVYRGLLQSPPPGHDHAKLLSEEEIPWDQLDPPKSRGMLRRFFRERAIDQFGLYTDFETDGRVASVGRTLERNFRSYLSQLESGWKGDTVES